MESPIDMLTTQGYDLQIGTNVLGTQPLLFFFLKKNRQSTLHRAFLSHKTTPPSSSVWRKVKSGREGSHRAYIVLCGLSFLPF